MRALTEQDLRFVVSRIPQDVRRAMKDFKLFLGGGFIRETIAGNKPSDIDLHGPDKFAARDVAQAMALKRNGRLISTKNAYTVLSHNRMPVQVITRWLYDNAEDMVMSFDFTVCQAAIWWEPKVSQEEDGNITDDGCWRSCCSESFYPDLAARRLVYSAPTRDEEAGGSLMRVIKFLKRGYTIQADSLAGVVARVAMKVRWGEVGENEGRAAHIIRGLLREVDPNINVDGIEPVDEHQTPD